MAKSTHADLQCALFDCVPTDGSAIGNLKLRGRVASRLGRDVDEADYLAAQQALVDAGRLIRGKGRGGSVMRAQAADSALTLEAKPIPEGADLPKPKQPGLPLPNRKPGEPTRGKRKQPGEEKVLAYRHEDKRINNPEVGLVNPEDDRDERETRYAWDPHIDPALQFDVTRSQVENLIDDALASGDDATMRKALMQLKRMAAPYLNWSGKAERTSFEVDTVSLHVHERVDPATILAALKKRVKAGGVGEEPAPWQPDFYRAWFEQPLPLREAIEFYQHDRGWANRLISGDSLLVMNSLVQKESMAGRVQMIYMDPPYGIKYGSNFQPFVNKRDVKDRKDEDLTAEPEMIKAFRDIWELGIHSYLTYLRDRLLLAKQLLHESGSVFVQISDENLHHVRELCDEIFGATNLVSVITFKKTTGAGSPTGGTNVLAATNDYIVWYAKELQKVKYRQLYLSRGGEGWVNYDYIRLPTGEHRRMTKTESRDWQSLPHGSFVYRRDNLTSTSSSGDASKPFDYCGSSYSPLPGGWKTSINEGMPRMAMSARMEAYGKTLAYRRFADDFPWFKLTNLWDDTVTGGFAEDRYYVVQTGQKVIERCLLMTTDPGDLVLDPTCGSGTTAYVAEKWGRRWITCDTSRVAVTLAKQRLMTASYDYYDLKYPHEGLKSGFIYKTVPHVTLKSIANNPEIDEIHARMHPAIERALADLNQALAGARLPTTSIAFRIGEGGRKGETISFDERAARAGALLREWEVPFEFPDDWPAAARKPFDAFHTARQAMQKKMDDSIATHADTEILYDQPQVNREKLRISGPFTVEAVPFPTVLTLEEAEQPRQADVAIARSGESSRQHQWRDELLKTGIRGRGGQMLKFATLETMPGTSYLHCTGTLAEGNERVVVSFGPEYAALEQRQVQLALNEAEKLRPSPKFIVFAAFTFDPEAAKDIDETRWPGVTLLKAQMNTDLLTDDLKKNRSSNQSFWLMGQPEVELRKRKDGKYEVEVNGFDYFDTRSGKLESGGKNKIAMWLLDTDYDERSLFPRQVFFPMAGRKDGWNKLKRDIKTELDEAALERFHGTVSLPFEPGDNRRVAVKIVDDRGIESLKIIPLRD
jgi:adenine-specific DNA-methyltransferase